MNIFGWLESSSQRRAVERFMVKLINQKHLLERTQDHDRQEPRTPASLEIAVTEWQGHAPVPNTTFLTSTRDITLTGLSFLSAQPVPAGQRVALSIYVEGERHHLLGEVKHSTRLGPATLLVGCEVLAPLPSLPELTFENA